MRCKVFKCWHVDDNAEEVINEWFDANPDIIFVSALQGPSITVSRDGGVYTYDKLTIFFKENPKTLA